MKNKLVKIAVIAAIASITVGGVCLGAGLAMGGSPSFYYDKNGIHVKEDAAPEMTQDHVMEYTKIDAVKNLDISLVDAEFTIVSGKEWAVEYVLSGCRMEPEYSLDEQTLKIRESRSSQSGGSHVFGWGHYWWYDDESNWQSPYVKITVPDTGKLEQVTIASEYGDVYIEKNLKARNVCVDTENGDVELDGWVGDSISFEMKYGGLTTGNMEGRSVTVKSENGAVKMGALQVEAADFTMEYGDLSATVKEASSLEVDNDNGSVTLGLSGGMEKYGVSLHTDWGTIRTPQGIVEVDEYEGGSDFIRTADDIAGIRIHTEYGDIRVKDEA